MASADNPNPVLEPTLEPGPALFRAIENVIVAQPMLAHSLKAPFPAWGSPLTKAVEQYGGESPLVGLWAALNAMEMLRRAWTGTAGAEVVAVVQVAGEVGDA
jgi:hypothetical protein